TSKESLGAPGNKRLMIVDFGTPYSSGRQSVESDDDDDDDDDDIGSIWIPLD
ncbi:jg20958, partial [Pararge aegeria aegeria]